MPTGRNYWCQRTVRHMSIREPWSYLDWELEEGFNVGDHRGHGVAWISGLTGQLSLFPRKQTSARIKMDLDLFKSGTSSLCGSGGDLKPWPRRSLQFFSYLQHLRCYPALLHTKEKDFVSTAPSWEWLEIFLPPGVLLPLSHLLCHSHNTRGQTGLGAVLGWAGSTAP